MGIDLVEGAFLKDPIITGTVTDANLDRYTVELATGPASTAYDWAVIATGQGELSSGPLVDFMALPPGGVHSLRVRAVDLAGNERAVVRSFQVDTTPSAAPMALVATLQGSNDVALTWTASPSTDVAGYRLLRGRAGEGLARRPGALVQGTSMVDRGVPDGTWTYAVVAVDLADLESSRTNEASVEIDTARPTATIASPAAGARVRAVVTVQGAATAKQFREYRLSVGVGASPASFTSVRTSPAPVTGILGTVDTTGFASGATLTLRLEAEDARGRVAEARSSVVVDNTGPAAPVLVSVTPSGRYAYAVWRASTEPDLAGYLLFRNGVLVNAAEGASLDDLARYLLSRTSTSYSDSNLDDGTYRYELRAMDQAGNLSPPSNAISVRIELRTPAAEIVDPPSEARLAGSQLLTAQVADQDLASVRFEARSRSDAPFTALGPALTAYPWAARLDWSAFPDGVVEVRVVATDTSGHADPNPASSFYFHDSVPEAPEVSTVTDGHLVAVSWTDVNVPGTLAGYEVTTSDVTASSPELSGLAFASSSAAGKTAEAAHDGDPATSWTAAGPGPQRWELDLAEPQVVRGVQVSIGSSSPGALVSLRCRGLWIPVGSQSWGTLAISPPFEADAVALEFNSATLTPSLSEVQVETVPLVAGPPVVIERTWGTGTHGVIPTTPFGLTAEGMASSDVYQPYVSSTATVVRTPSVMLEGGYFSSGTIAHLFANGVEIAALAADGYYFNHEAPLTLGDNVFTVQGIDSLGNRSLVSEPWTVRYEPPPQVTLGLTLVAQSGSDASFAINAGGDLAQLTGMQVLRADASSPTGVPVQQLSPDQFTFEEQGLLNGTYVYTVLPLFGELTGESSNAVVVTVALTPPAPPHDLTVTLAPMQDALDLAWAYDADPPYGFELQRSSGQGGWEVLGWTDGLGSSFEDGQVEPGVLYRYRVVALDALGNASEPSNEASGALPPQPPGAPRLVSPTDPDHPITVQNTTVLVGGFADRPGRTISIFQNGRPVGTAQAQEPSMSQTPLALARSVQDPFEVGIQDGGYLAYLSWDDTAQRQVLAIEDPGGAAWTLTAPGAQLSGRPALSPDGKQALVGGYDAVDGAYHLYGGEVASGLLLPLASAPEPDDAVAWSPDSTAYAFARSGTAGRELVVVDAATGVVRVIWSDPSADEHAVAWLGTETVVAVVEPTDPAQPYVLASFDALTGARTDLFTGSSVERALGASSGGGPLVFGAADLTTGDRGIYAVDALTRSPWLVAPVWNGVDELAPSPDGASVAVRFGGWLAVAELSGDGAEDWGWCGWSHLAWTTGLGLVATGDGGTVRLDRGPWFELPDVTLDAGLNSFRAYGVDATGQRSEASAPILVRHPVDLPDLAVTAAVAPQNPMRGQPVQAAIQVRNVGAVDSAPAGLVVQLAAAGVVRDVARQTVPALEAGTSTSLPFRLDLAGFDGALQLTAMIDPEQAVEDGDRSNNSVYATITITDTDHVTVWVDAQPAIVDAGGVITGTAIVRNPGPDAAFTVRMRLADAGGDAVVAPDTAVAVAAGGNATVSRDLSVGVMLAGDYSLIAEVYSGSMRVASAAAPVSVRAERSVALDLEADRYRYQPGDDVVLSSTVTNLSRNAALTGATIRVAVLDAGGTTAWSGTDAQLPMLWMGGITGAESVVPRGMLLAGDYRAVATVELGGDILAQDSTTFTVAARDVLAASLSVAGVGDPPEVAAGSPAIVAVAFQNAGTAASPATTGRLVLLAPRTGEVLRTQDVAVPALAVGAAASQAAVVPTTGLHLDTYGLALVADVQGAATTLATARFRVADASAPVLALQSPGQGAVVPGVVYPWVRAYDGDTGVVAVRAAVGGAVVPLTLNGGNALDGTWSGGITLGPDGTYVIVFTAADGEGNDGLTGPTASDPITLTVVSDRTPPVLTVAGVADGAVVNTPVTLGVTATDLHLATVSAAVDGVAYQPGTAYAVEGTHVFWASAIDLAGNTATDVRVFEVDLTPPEVSIAGVADGQYLGSAAAPVVVVTDANPVTYTALLDGSPWSGGVIGGEGRHVLAVDAQDSAGNTRHAEVGFWVDLTPPALQIAGVENGVCYARPVTPVVTGTDANLGSVSSTLDGQSFSSGTTVGQDGAHALAAVARDLAGHETAGQVAFTVDTTPPAITMPDVDGRYFAAPVTLVYSVDDATAIDVQATLDGVGFGSGGQASAEGRHVFTIEVRDCAGNVSSRTATFVVDRTPPTLLLSGVLDGAVVAGPVAITAVAEDANLVSVALELDGAPYTAGAPITAPGLHLVTGVATDAAGNSTRASLGFTLDSAPPRIVVEGVADGDVLGRAVTPIVTVTDDDLADWELAVDGVVLLPGATITAEGVHQLVVTAHDSAGNQASLALEFTIDLTPPALEIGGVSGGVCYADDVTPTYTARDANLASVAATLDGAAFASGTVVGAEGDHALAVTARDLAEHAVASTTGFVVDKTAPTVTIPNLDGRYFAGPVTPSYTVIDPHLTTTVATLDGAKLAPGARVSAEGVHTLAVTAQDCAGNSRVHSASFTIDQTPPALTLTGVAEAAVVKSPVRVTDTATDRTPTTVAMTLDGAEYVSGAAIAVQGVHTVVAVATDAAGNASRATRSFTIDDTPPVIQIAGVAEGEVTSRDVVPAITVTDDHPADWTATADGVELTPGGAITTEETHTVIVVAHDQAGNEARATVSFEIDRTPPVISASVADGVEYAPPRTVTYSASDAHLGPVTAKMDGQPFTSGGAVTAAGSHTLVVTADDAAGNEAVRSYRFTITGQGPKYHVEKKLVLGDMRVLARVACGKVGDASAAFLARALSAAQLKTVRNDSDLLVAMRSGLYDLVVITDEVSGVAPTGASASSQTAKASGGEAVAVTGAMVNCVDPCPPTLPVPPLSSSELSRRLPAELTEAVHRGVGLLVFRTSTPAEPWLREALGLQFLGNEGATTVSILQTAVSGAMQLRVADGVALKLDAARSIGTFKRDGKAAAAFHGHGLGEVVVFGFDPARASGGTEALVAGAVAFAFTESDPAAAGVVAVRIEVKDEGAPATTRVREHLAPELVVVGIRNGGVKLPSGDLEWLLDQDAGEVDALEYLLELPEVAGTYQTTAEVAQMVAGQAQVVGTYPLSITLQAGAKELQAQAEQLAAAIPSQGCNKSHRSAILADLALVRASAGRTAKEREAAIAALLDAVDHVKALQGVDGMPLRLAIDSVLAVWEGR